MNTFDKRVSLTHHKVTNGAGGPLSATLLQSLRDSFNHRCRVVELLDVTDAVTGGDTTVVSLVEVDKCILSRMTAEEMDALRHLAATARTIVWVNSGDAGKGGNPESAISIGLFRSLRLEYLSLELFTLTVDDILHDHEAASAHVLAIASQAPGLYPVDNEFVQSRGQLYFSRFIPDEALCSSFLQSVRKTPAARELSEAKPCTMRIGYVGQFDSIYFVQEDEPDDDLADDEVEIEVHCVGINAKVSHFPD